jgi:hypothetical protein
LESGPILNVEEPTPAKRTKKKKSLRFKKLMAFFLPKRRPHLPRREKVKEIKRN